MRSNILLALCAPVLVLLPWQERASPASPAGAPQAEAPDPSDPAVLRLRLLRRLDAHIDEVATQSRLAARLALDEVYPLPYLGVDTQLEGADLKIVAVYADTGAERCGLRVGDVLRSFAGVKLASKPALARNVRRHAVGDRVALEIERAGSRMSLAATLGIRPEEDEDEEEQFPDLVVPIVLPAPRILGFDVDPLGVLPPAFESVLGGHGRQGAWRTVELEGARVLRQDDGDATGIRFPMAIVRDWEAGDAAAKVRFRYAGGRIDRAAGLVLRWRDAGDYYVARANAQEGDLRIFRVVHGERRTLLGAIAKGATDDDRWHTLEFRAEGAKLTATLDGSVQATAWDSYFLRGRVGLWTKSDSLTEFDDLSLEALR